MGSARWFWIIAVGSRWGVDASLWHLVEFHWVLLAGRRWFFCHGFGPWSFEIAVSFVVVVAFSALLIWWSRPGNGLPFNRRTGRQFNADGMCIDFAFRA